MLSGPLLLSASFANVPILIQEQNSYAGITNKFLAKKCQENMCRPIQKWKQFFSCV